MDRHDYLPLLGLALRGGRLAAGEDAAQAAVRAKDARLLVVAAGASQRTRRCAERLAEDGACLLLPLPCSTEELGHALGRKSVAVAAVTDLGLALAAVRRLAARNPERYGQAVERLELKARRAAERSAKRTEARPAEKPGVRRTKGAGRAKAPYAARQAKKPGAGPPRRKNRGSASPYTHSRPVKKGKGSF